MAHDPAKLEQRLNAGEWLRPGAVAALLGLSRNTAHRMLVAGKIGYRLTPGGYRECDPADVRRLLDARRRLHHGEPETPPR
jgi:hypothetical protein